MERLCEVVGSEDLVIPPGNSRPVSQVNATTTRTMCFLFAPAAERAKRWVEQLPPPLCDLTAGDLLDLLTPEERADAAAKNHWPHAGVPTPDAARGVVIFFPFLFP